jgi:hypothetical protein
VLLACLRYVLTFLLLTAAAPQGVSTAEASEPNSFDEAPAATVSIGNKTPEPSAVEPFTLFIALPARRWPALRSVAVPVAARPPQCVRRNISRLHWVRRRVPRMRDDAPDH